MSQAARRSAALVLFAVIAVAHLAGSVLAYEVNNVTSQGVSLFPAAGVTVAALLLVPRRSWWVVLGATLVAELLANLLLIDEVVGTAVGSALSNVVEPWLGAYLVLRWLGRTPALDRSRDLLAFFAGAVVAGPVLGTLVGVTSTRFTPGHASFFHVAGRWFVGDGLGVLIVGSLILAWGVPAGSERRSRVEELGLLGSLLAVTAFAFWGPLPTLAFATLPFLGWAALRFGVRGATSGAAVVAALADWATLSGHGLFFRLSQTQRDSALWQLQLFLGVLLLTSLLLASQVSELHRASNALRAAEDDRRFKVLLEGTPDPVLIVDLDGTLEYGNPSFQQLVRLEPAALAGRPVQSLLPAESRTAVIDALVAARTAAEGSRTTFELVGEGTDGPWRFEAAVSPMRRDAGMVLIATLRDVTERSQVEQATRGALLAAEQATEAKSSFLAMMSHEIRTPMNGVIGMVDILERMSLGAEQRQVVDTISESAQLLLAVIDDILDFSKIEAGKLDLEEAPFDARDMLDGVAEVLAASAAAKSVELSSVIAPDVPDRMVGDCVRLRQVAFNLAGNAVKFTETGSVRLELSLAGSLLRLTVTDTGIGMTDEQQQRLFEPFEQADRSTTRRFGGSGLGLAIVFRLVALMDGTISVDSALGEGSTFTVELPLPALPDTGDGKDLLRGLQVGVLGPDPASPPVLGAVTALRRAGATVELAATGDVVYVTRELRGAADPAALVPSGPVVVCERTADGATWLPRSQAPATSARTGRSVVRAVAAAGGRGVAPERVTAVRAASPLVLVAEDHPTNQLVARRQLALLGISCEVVEDGIEALEVLARREVALLLADCHMPRLDGFELTRRIRESEQGTGKRLPIVALTASALPAEAERCLAAGMDLVLTKPVALEALDRALAPFLDGVRRVDLSVLRDIVGDDPEAVGELVSTFRTSATESVALLDAARAEGDEQGVRSAVHRLMGGARTMGAGQLIMLCESVESVPDMPDDALLTSLATEVRAVLKALESLVQGAA